MKKILSAFVGCTVVLSGCQNMEPIGGVSTKDENVAAIEEAIKANDTHSANTPPPAPALLPPLDFKGKKAKAEERFDIAADGLPALDFFMGLVQDTPYNMIVHQDVSGTITVDLKNVTVSEVMEAIHLVYGYEYSKTGDLYRVLPVTLKTEIFKIDYLDIERTGTSDSHVSLGSVASVDENGDSQDNQSASIQTKTATDFWGKLGSTLKSIIQGEGRQVIVTPQTGSVVVRALPSELTTVRNYLAQAELILNRQVIIEAKILEVTLNSGYQAGVDWSALATGDGSDSLVLSQTRQDIVNSDDIGGVFKAGLQLNNFTAVIELLATQGEVQVLSSPRVSTVNNQKALIKVGTDEFFVTGIESNVATNTTGTIATISPSIELTPFFSGISLDVTPQISEEGDIVLHIHPSVSEVLDQQKHLNVGSSNYQLPLALSTIRESDSIVRAESGQIIVIGGLMKSSSTHIDAETPGLGDVPVVGELFQQKRQRATKSELVIMLRPILATQDNLHNELKRSLKTFNSLNAATSQ